eukprot:5107013-Amphidinium_carterae.1
MSSTYLRTSTCRPALCKVRIKNACSKSTARPHPGGSPQCKGRKSTGTLHGGTHRALNEDAPIATVHIQGTVKRI